MNKASFFKHSQIISFSYNLMVFLTSLICGYMVSWLLNVAMLGDVKKSLIFGSIALAIVFVSIVPLYVLSKKKSKAVLCDKQLYREFLYNAVIQNRLDAESFGEMDVKLNKDAQTIARYYQDTVTQALCSMVILIVSFAMLLAYNVALAVIFFCMNLLQLLPTVLYECWAKKIYNRVRADESIYCDWLIEGHSGIRTIKAYEQEGFFMSKFSKLNKQVYHSGKMAEKVGTVETIVGEIINAALKYGSLVIIGVFILLGKVDVMLAPILIVLSSFLFSSATDIYDLRLAYFAWEEANKRLELHDLAEHKNDDAKLISIDSVEKSFGDMKVLDKISFSVERGEKILLKGKNGSGKSTLLRIILGFMQADSGFVYYNKSVFGDDLYKKISFAMQEESDLYQTADEILKELVTSKEVDATLLDKHLSGLNISSELLNKKLSELSMGERKKIFLAVAFAKPCELLILDEPTNHIDVDSQQYIIKQMQSSRAAMLVCTHSELPINWDKTIELEKGEQYEK